MKIALYTLASEEQLWQVIKIDNQSLHFYANLLGMQDLDELWQRMHAGYVCSSHEYRSVHHYNLYIAVVWLCSFFHTLPGEVRRIWMMPPSGSSALFVANRYGSFLYQVLAIVFGFPGTHASEQQ